MFSQQLLLVIFPCLDPGFLLTRYRGGGGGRVAHRHQGCICGGGVACCDDGAVSIGLMISVAGCVAIVVVVAQ